MIPRFNVRQFSYLRNMIANILLELLLYILNPTELLQNPLDISLVQLAKLLIIWNEHYSLTVLIRVLINSSRGIATGLIGAIPVFGAMI